MITLSIEASAKACSAALTDGERLIAQYFQNSGLTHSRTLLCMVEDILKNNELAIADVSRIAVGRGPGSFTGIRIALAAAKGLAWGANLPLCGVSTLEAAASVFVAENTIICPTMDARRGEVYNALFEVCGGSLTRLCADRALPAAELAAELKRSEKPILLTGDGAELTAKAFAECGIAFRLAPPLLRLQCAYGVALAARNAPDDAELEPNYLRVSQAERERGAASQTDRESKI
ncbi:MAG: tRNA (adenosine(37)-N6)-threonylcarbamoyltransferase complex dimerization subunit type 1 TsaB [Oscillospiraceae bacterium]|jgi:tRNA threonylcarbamoyladenosine biosynthesis protein TsaB|nr:tRNA (adenosine(37)-N6)-threonylcarbamoyltransferase complex dimerization subunit type 1 TsaB [Oscillospiraceae bacterium]